MSVCVCVLSIVDNDQIRKVSLFDELGRRGERRLDEEKGGGVILMRRSADFR